MTKLLVRCFLLLSIFLIGYTHLYVHAYWDGIQDASIKISEGAEHASFDATQESGPLMMFASFEKHIFKLHAGEVTEEEEDDHQSNSFKMKLVSSECFTAIFCDQTTSCFFKQVFFLSHRIHLIVRVFRI